MKKSRFTEHQIIAILKETDAEQKIQEVCRHHGISQATYYQPRRSHESQSMAAWKLQILNGYGI
jgi:transposase-like protein